MKSLPLLVIALVLAAIGALFLASDWGGSGDSTTQTGIEVTPKGPEETTPAPADLTAVQPGERSIAQVDPATQSSGRVDTASGNGGDFWNNALSGVVMNTKQQVIEGAEVTLTRAAAASRIFANEPTDRSKDVKAITDQDGVYRFANVEPYEFYMVEATAEGYSMGAVDSIAVGETGDFEAPPVQLALGATLTGLVRDTGGNVVPGAILTLSDQFHRPGMELAPGSLVATSDGGGRYIIENIPAGNRTLTIEADGYGNMSFGGLVFRNTDPVERDVVLEIAEMISGRVISKTGQPIEGAEVMAMSYTNSSRASRDVAFTSSDGEFVLDALSPGQYTIAVRATGFRPGSESRVKTGASGLVIQLSPQATITGKVLADGVPVPEYKVRLRQTYANNPATSAVGQELTFSEADGSFMIDSVQPNTYVVQATAPGYAPSYSDEFQVQIGMPVKGVIVHLTRGGALLGVAIDKNGKRIPRPRVSTHDNTWANTVFDQALGDQFPTNATSRKVTGQADGRFKISGLKGETYQVRVNAPGYCELILQDTYVADGADTDLGEVTLMKGGTVSGQVLDATGSVVPGASVNLRPDGRPDGLPRSYSARTGADGKYTITGIYPGAYLLSAMRGGRANDFLGELAHEQDTTQRLTIGDEQTLRFELKINN
jgi:protocatechuate 3,4-dioxygenase beta subunit